MQIDEHKEQNGAEIKQLRKAHLIVNWPLLWTTACFWLKANYLAEQPHANGQK